MLQADPGGLGSDQNSQSRTKRGGEGGMEGGEEGGGRGGKGERANIHTITLYMSLHNLKRSSQLCQVSEKTEQHQVGLKLLRTRALTMSKKNCEVATEVTTSLVMSRNSMTSTNVL